MERIFVEIVNMSMSAGILILAVILLRMALRRAPKWIICALWALVAVKLLCPVSISSPVSVYRVINLSGNGGGIVSEAERLAAGGRDSASGEALRTDGGETYTVSGEFLQAEDGETYTVSGELVQAGDGEMYTVSGEVQPADGGLISSDSGKTEFISVSAVVKGVIDGVTRDTWAGAGTAYLRIAVVVWEIGMAILLLYGMLSTAKLRLSLRDAVRLRDNIYLSDSVRYPFIFGILRPRIYLCSGMEEEQRGYVIAHERAHLRRLDHFWKAAGFLLLCVYWFQPLCWIAYLLLCRDIELACDEKVIRDKELSWRKEYSMTLLECSMQGRRVMACPLAFSEVGVKERVKAVLNYKKPAFWTVVVAVIICFAAALGFLTAPPRTYQIGVTIPEGGTSSSCFSDEEISPKGKILILYAGEGMGEGEILLRRVSEDGSDRNAENPAESDDRTAHITPGSPVKFEVEKGAWYRIGFVNKEQSAEGGKIYVSAENVTVRIASLDSASAEQQDGSGNTPEGADDPREEADLSQGESDDIGVSSAAGEETPAQGREIVFSSEYEDYQAEVYRTDEEAVFYRLLISDREGRQIYESESFYCCDTDAFSIEPIEELMGFSGFCLHYQEHPYTQEAFYVGLDGDRGILLGEVWCYEFADIRDFDGDGRSELISTVMFMGDGAISTVMYRYDGTQVLKGWADDLLDEEYDYLPSCAGERSEYLPEEGVVEIFYFIEAEGDYRSKKYEIDIDKIKWFPFIGL